MKYLFFIFLASALGCSAEISLEPALTGHQKAFQALQAVEHKIQVDSYTTKEVSWHYMSGCGYGYSCCDVHPHISYTRHFDYRSADPQAKQAAYAYFEILNTLETRLILTAGGEGFILGALTAILNKLTNKNAEDTGPDIWVKYNPYLVACGVLASIGLVLYHNHQTQPVPYFNEFLHQEQNLFEHLSGMTLGRCCAALVGCGLGFLGTDFLISQCRQFYKKTMQTPQEEYVTDNDNIDHLLC